ncbi:N-acetyltransferase [Endomicrobium proavitum]|uniref:Putative N-acetyltransferase n=1 Tax=Endomicrobium proavitum TaxID=1408281 RepID=A0A0G3WHA7_9BACT|nr:N-acetyltransferase [Endomicrobium proavitum]AKL97713.1 putative N-acetyltransferase [Endomicrobium proavitum]
MKIRSAKVLDVKSIHKLVEFYANNKEMLHRSLNAIYENIQEYIVVENENGIIGCGALHVSWEDLAEVKALAVSPQYAKQGIGKKIVRTLEKNAQALGINKVFALSFKPEFFIKLGYKVIPKEILPHKIWSECINCHLFPDCGEVPLLIELDK